jgi:hypothetical protein
VLSEEVEYQLKEDKITHQTLGYPRFLKHENIDTETLFMIAQSKFQYVEKVTCYGNSCEFQKSGCYTKFYERIQNLPRESGRVCEPKHSVLEV